MKHFWHGFEKNSAPVQFKKHVIILYWEPESTSDLKNMVENAAKKYPSIKVRVINVKKEPTKPLKHKVRSFPTVLLLKDGREVDRLSSDSPTLIEQMFREANS